MDVVGGPTNPVNEWFSEEIESDDFLHRVVQE